LPIDFENLQTSDFINFDGGMASVISNPEIGGINTSETVAQIVRNGGEIWAGAKIDLDSNVDWANLNSISMKVFTSAPVGTVIKFKLEGNGATERDMYTTVSNEWETISWDFTGEPANYNSLVFMFDFGNVGDGSVNSTFLFDDIEQFDAGIQLDLPVTFEEADVNYNVTDFGGNMSSLVVDPEDENNTVIKTIKTDQAAAWAGTTIGTPAGFANYIPLTLTDSKMTVRVWSPAQGTPIRLKVEDANDPTHTCETQVNTQLFGEWETLEFDFPQEATGTQPLHIGLSMGWQFNMASIFFNFGTEGSLIGERTYYFDDVYFGEMVSNTEEQALDLQVNVYPNPTQNDWKFSKEGEMISQIEIFNLQGERLNWLKANAEEVIVKSQDLLPGLYLAKVYTLRGKQTLKIYKN